MGTVDFLALDRRRAGQVGGRSPSDDQDGAVEHFQVGLKVGFRLEDDGDID